MPFKRGDPAHKAAAAKGGRNSKRPKRSEEEKRRLKAEAREKRQAELIVANAAKWLDEATAEKAEEIFQAVYTAAMDGDSSCLRLLVDRIWPARKGARIIFAPPVIETADDVGGAIDHIMSLVADGTMSGEEAQPLYKYVEQRIRAFELVEQNERLDALEEQLERLNSVRMAA